MRIFKTNKQKYDEAFEEVNPFEKVPDDLKGTSIKKISELLSTHDIKSPDHFRLVHELNRRTENIQAKAIYISIVFALLGIALGWSLSHWYPSEPKASLTVILNYIKKQDQGGRNNKGKDETGDKMLPSPSTISNPVQPINRTDSQADNYQHKQEGNNAQSK